MPFSGAEFIGIAKALCTHTLIQYTRNGSPVIL